ncbi:MAG: elongation factor P [Chlamydiae bacterium]|jgi:elongation factor P|nr:elongation factor P [Chlamydiota bacterium]
MITSNQLSPGMTIVIDQKIYRVESAVMVTVAKGVPFVKTKLKNIMTDEALEKSFKLEQQIEEVRLAEKRLEYLYLEGKSHLFLDIDSLDQVLVMQSIIEDKVQFLKEGIQIKAMFYGEQIFSVELPQFLEIMVSKVDEIDQKNFSGTTKFATLETGAKIEVPLFIDSGDVIKVDTSSSEYVQRV